MSTPRTRIGGHVVVDCLERAGVEALFGVPGIHSLSIWDGLVGSPIRNVGMRTELAAGFAADGYAPCGVAAGRAAHDDGARLAGRRVRPDGGADELRPRRQHRLAGAPRRDRQRPGLPARAGDPVGGALGAGEVARGRAVGRGAARAHRRGVPPGDLRRPWPGRAGGAGRRPRGCDDGSRTGALRRRAGAAPIARPRPDRRGRAVAGRRRATRAVGRRRRAARRRCGARSAALAEQLDAPAATTFMGKGAIPGDHPLALGSACDEGSFQELLRTADVVLAVGTELGAETTGQWTLEFEGRLIQVDARPEHLGATYEGLGIAGDARAVARGARGGRLVARVATARNASGPCTTGSAPDSPRRGATRSCTCCADLRAALGRDDVLVCDMTITGYLAAPFFDVYAPGTFLYPLGSGTLGYAWPAAIGAKVATARVAGARRARRRRRALLRSSSCCPRGSTGSGRSSLVVDDSGYGILRVYQHGRLRTDERRSTSRSRTSRRSSARSACRCSRRVRAASHGPLDAALAFDGPAFVHLPQTVVFPEATR